MPITEQQIRHALSHVDDPDLKKDLITLNMVRDIKIQNQNVSFTVVLTTPACPLKEMIRNACITAIHTFVDKSLNVEVNMTANTISAANALAFLPGVRNLIGIASGKGGVGKSTISANLAVALARTGARVGLLDADIYGPSAPLLFSLVNQKPYMRNVAGKDKMVPILSHGVYVMSIGFLVDAAQAVVWRGPMASNALRQLTQDTLWEEIDYLIVDMPPGTGDIHITLSQQFPLSGVIMVTTPQPVAVADARKAAAMFHNPAINIPILGVVENMAYFSPPEYPDKRYYLFGQGGGATLAAELNVPLLAELPLVEAIRQNADDGIAPSPNTPEGKAFAALAAETARQVSIRNLQAQTV
jgi:ATP-binding protein involved in chromosome partitioning